MAQARAALQKHKDVMQAAEHIFDGSFDHLLDPDGDVTMESSEAPPPAPKPRMMVSRATTLSFVLITYSTLHNRHLTTTKMPRKCPVKMMMRATVCYYPSCAVSR